MKVIKLTNSTLTSTVDDDAPQLIFERNWQLHKKGYAQSGNFMLHQLILPTYIVSVIDHRDHNKLNNCKNNLRLVTQSANKLHNRGTGIAKRNARKGFQVIIQGKYFGFYPTFDDALEVAKKIKTLLLKQALKETRWLNPHLSDEEYFSFHGLQ